MSKRHYHRLADVEPFVRELHAEGLHDPDVALTFNVHTSTARAWRLRLGLPANLQAAKNAQRQNLSSTWANPASARANRARACALGWPGRTLREAQVLSFVHARRQVTVRQVQAALGCGYRMAHALAARLLSRGELRRVLVHRLPAPGGAAVLALAEGVGPVGAGRLTP